MLRKEEKMFYEYVQRQHEYKSNVFCGTEFLLIFELDEQLYRLESIKILYELVLMRFSLCLRLFVLLVE